MLQHVERIRHDLFDAFLSRIPAKPACTEKINMKRSESSKFADGNYFLCLLRSRRMRKDLPLAQVHGRLILGCPGYLLLQVLQGRVSMSCPRSPHQTLGLVQTLLTSLSNTHLFKPLSIFRHCHNCWLLLSRHSQCLRNSSKHDLLMSSNLHIPTCQRITQAYLRLHSILDV